MIEHWSSMSCLHMILCQPCTLVAFFVVRRDMRFLFRIWHPRYAHAPGIFHHLFTGVPGELGAYWQRNQDLASKVGWPNVDSWRVIRLPKHLVSYFVVLPLRYPKKKLRTKSFSASHLWWRGRCPTTLRNLYDPPSNWSQLLNFGY